MIDFWNEYLKIPKELPEGYLTYSTFWPDTQFTEIVVTKKDSKVGDIFWKIHLSKEEIEDSKDLKGMLSRQINWAIENLENYDHS